MADIKWADMDFKIRTAASIAAGSICCIMVSALIRAIRGRHLMGEPVSIHDVAAYILEKTGPISTMKLQKLCYYCQGWNLAWDEEPLFKEDFEAWANGPVCYDLFKKHKGKFKVESWSFGNPDKLDENQRETVDVVLNAYGHLDGRQLSRRTHREQPWITARNGLTPGESSRARIDIDAMAEYFSGLDADDVEA